ncbi:MAG: HD-GYP domain-containing protein [Actinobacteria bacterium]|nr:HD-GYP domain-containing protein [Actinomycetota bacterium]
MTRVPAPGLAALKAVRPLLRALSSARQTFALYPGGHPERTAVVRQLRDHMRKLLDSVDEPVLFVARRSLYLGPTLLARESLASADLVKRFEDAGIFAVEILPGVDEDDVLALIQMLEGDRPADQLHGGLRINRVKPTLDVVAEQQLQLQELRALYGEGLEVLRQAAVRVASGDAVDLGTAVSLVERLADEVVRDPTNALLLTTVKSYDEYTYYHMINVCMLSVALGNAVGLHREQVVALGIGGLLHDVGKVNVPSEILTHVGKLDEEQWRLIQRHPIEGAGLLFSTTEGLYHPAAAVVLEHHAAYDLKGYPSLTGRPHPSIPARLVSVADCFDAVTSKRAYRAAAGRQQALSILESAAGKGFDPRMVNVFIGVLGVFPIGSLVRLDSGEVALVVDYVDDHHTARPRVRPVLDAGGNAVVGEDRDLTATRPDGTYLWNVTGTVDPGELGFDVVEFLSTGDLDAAFATTDETPQGLVHEPSPGESVPEGYVDTHRDNHGAVPVTLDPDVAPPFEPEG